MGNGCIVQRAQPGALWQPRQVEWGWWWEGGLREREYMYIYGWFIYREEKVYIKNIKTR